MALVLATAVASLATPATAEPTVGEEFDAGVTPQVYGGQPVASPNPYPWMTPLLLSSRSNPGQAQFCGGMIVAPAWVLTAAHCVDRGRRPSDVQVAPGVLLLSSITAASRQAVAEIIIHPSWNRSTFEYDVALLRLAKPSRNNDIPPVALVSEGRTLPAGTPTFVLGWGEDGNGRFFDDLLGANLQVAAGDSATQCGGYGSDYRRLTMICASGGQLANTSDSCPGDSGGPLVLNAGGRLEIVGIVSWGEISSQYNCGLQNFPGVYTRVSAVRSWINQRITRFVDVPAGSYYDTAAHELARRGITSGTPSASEFSPSASVTRAQMASFLWKMAGEPSAPNHVFRDEADIPTWARTATDWLYSRGITTNDPYNPRGTVTRAEMATFLWRYGDRPSAPNRVFRDEAQIPTSAKAATDWLFARGITTNDPYKPGDRVSRAQMATFLVRAAPVVGAW